MLTTLASILKSKTGDINSTGNYHPIALTTVSSKIKETSLVSKVESFFYTNDNQFAYSTDMCIYLLNPNWTGRTCMSIPG